MSEGPRSGAPRGRGAVRLRFTYEGRRPRLLSADRVDMPAPPTDELDGYEGRRGFWVEVRDPGGRTLHRRVMADPMDPTVEVFSAAPEATLRRVRAGRPRGAFTVVVPDLDGADHLALMGAPEGLDGLRTAGASAELARFPLGGGREAS
ncbi:hypothetical protein [Actinomadura parmotrematis]|uniref:Uncharacterized protein n=1 Tax=Actinomadura parmotrematis TaxID=2864039 RepID=A0ABS7G469_9ACTN|nr:hypothetical protein [Actinomadura parmotrematis]MBW8487518.1 hypothetical protein [Actinomadura parmotrematis]